MLDYVQAIKNQSDILISNVRKMNLDRNSTGMIKNRRLRFTVAAMKCVSDELVDFEGMKENIFTSVILTVDS